MVKYSKKLWFKEPATSEGALSRCSGRQNVLPFHRIQQQIQQGHFTVENELMKSFSLIFQLEGWYYTPPFFWYLWIEGTYFKDWFLSHPWINSRVFGRFIQLAVYGQTVTCPGFQVRNFASYLKELVRFYHPLIHSTISEESFSPFVLPPQILRHWIEEIQPFVDRLSTLLVELSFSWQRQRMSVTSCPSGRLKMPKWDIRPA